MSHLSVLSQLRTGIRGRVIGPEDPEYDAARTVFYTGFDRRPAAIVKVADAADVARVVTLAHESGAELAIRSGGHSLAGHGVTDGGIVIDLSAMRGLEIDVAGRTAWAETGLTAGEYTAAVGAHGLATGFGDTSSVGIGGITLGGGLGFLHRRYGLTIDNLLAAEIVTADGERILADEASHPDLFWAIRGGGGNFGVVTRFRFRLHEVGEVLGGIMVQLATPAVIVDVLAAAAEAPEGLSGVINVMPAPPMPMIPAEYHGRPVVGAFLVHSGPIEEGERVIARLRGIAPPIVDAIRPMRYPDVFHAEPPRPPRAVGRSLFLDAVDPAAAEFVIDSLRKSTALIRVAQFRVMGGAVARVARDATAFAHRDRAMMAFVCAGFAEPGEAAEHEAWVRRLAAELRQGEPGAYIGFTSDDGPAAVREAYPGATGERLAAIKAMYDPTNLFRRNVNIAPALATAG
jgi:FAD/FMN-containing dehydrogenase